MIRDLKAIEHPAHADLYRLRTNLATAGLWFCVVFVTTAAVAGWWLT